MNKFEKQFRDLPWAEPSANLRQRIFANTSSERSPMILRISRRAVGWAALWLLAGSVMGYGMGRGQGGPAAVPAPSPSEVIVVETDTDTHFFNQTDNIDEAIPGKWVLYIEPEGGNQG